MDDREIYVAPRTSMATKLQESVFNVNLSNRKKKDELLKKHMGFQEDFYAERKKETQMKIMNDDIEKARLGHEQQQRKHDQTLRPVVQKKLEELTINDCKYRERL